MKKTASEQKNTGPLILLYAAWKVVWVSASLFPFSVPALGNPLPFQGFALLIVYGMTVVFLYCTITAFRLLISVILPSELRQKTSSFAAAHKVPLLITATVCILLIPLLLLVLQGNAASFFRLSAYDGSGFVSWLHRGFSDINLPKRQLACFVMFYFLPIAFVDFILPAKHALLTRAEQATARLFSRPVAGTVFLSLMAAVLLRMQTERSCSNLPFDDTLFTQFPLHAIVNILLAFALTLLFGALSRSIAAGMVLTGALTTLLSLVNYYTLLWHGTYFRLEEIRNFRSAVNVLEGYRITVAAGPVHIILCFAAVCVIAYTAKKVLPRSDKKTVTCSVVFSVLFLGMVTLCFVLNNNESLSLWNLHALYNKNGMLLSTIQTTYANALPQVTLPDGYDSSLVSGDSLLQYAQDAKAEPADYPDIILILNEAWYDMDYLEETHADRDYLKTWHSLQENAITGHTLVPGTGGLTNASEYELLTSNSLHLLRTDTPNNVLGFGDSLSIVSYLESLGYVSLAAHPGNPASYRRGMVWEQLGFDESFFTDDFLNLEYYGNRTSFATDVSLFDEFTTLYESMPEDSPRLCFLLTIQNHGEWNHNPSELNYVKSGERFSYAPDVSAQIDEFLTCTSQTDDMIGQMTAYFQTSDRPVIVCMAGDHAPSFIHDVNSTKRTGKEEALAKRATPFLIWSNRPLYPVSLDSGMDDPVDLCSLTPLTLQAAGLPLSPYYGLLTQLPAEISCFTRVDLPEDVPMLSSYFNMEYNNIGEKSGQRNDRLFTP